MANSAMVSRVGIMRGAGKVEILANRLEILDLFSKGHSLCSVHKILMDKGAVSVKRRQFSKLVPRFIGATPSQNQPSELHAVSPAARSNSQSSKLHSSPSVRRPSSSDALTPAEAAQEASAGGIPSSDLPEGASANGNVLSGTRNGSSDNKASAGGSPLGDLPPVDFEW